MITAAAMYVALRLVDLSGVDAAIIIFYFALVLTIGFYLQRRANTGEDFFMAGREMTAWIAGLSFLSANLGSLELMGWAASAYQYGILATHWYWIGAIPAMLFLSIVMMPFYYISKTHSVPGYLRLRFVEQQPDGDSLDWHRVWFGVRDLFWLLDNGFFGSAAGARREGSPLREAGSDHWRSIQDARAVHRDPPGPARAGCAADEVDRRVNGGGYRAAHGHRST